MRDKRQVDNDAGPTPLLSAFKTEVSTGLMFVFWGRTHDLYLKPPLSFIKKCIEATQKQYMHKRKPCNVSTSRALWALLQVSLELVTASDKVAP